VVRTRSEKLELISLRRAAKTYGGRTIFRDVDLEVRAGECVGLTGGNGTGKSTLLRTMLGFTRLDQGEVRFEGKPVPSRERAWIPIRKRVGYVAQSLNLWPYKSAIDNVVEGLRFSRALPKSLALRKGASWLWRLGLRGHLRKFPASLSGGEQQRVAIARALAMDPELILLDEPASGLDPITMGEVAELIASLRKLGLSILIVSHQIDFIRRIADWAYFLNDGVIAESGPASETLTHPSTEGLSQFIAQVRRGW
jgi:ABC-type polar amino acid transport system ATPase subunit